MGEPTKMGTLLRLPSAAALDAGDEAAREYDRRVAAEAAREVVRARAERLAAVPECRLTDDMQTALVSGEALRPTRSQQAVRDWLAADATRQPWIVLAGGMGCGKSVAAAWAVAQRGAVWIRAERLVRIWAANFGEQYDEQEAARVCSLLVLDDVGSESDHARMQAVLLELADSRKSRRFSTIVTTNLSAQAFKRQYPEPRLHSRIREIGQWVVDGGEDMRRAPK